MEKDLQCAKCTQVFKATLPVATIMNQEVVSIAAWCHEKPIECPHCGQAYQFVMKAVHNVSFVYLPIEKAEPEEERLIVVPEGIIKPS